MSHSTTATLDTAADDTHATTTTSDDIRTAPTPTNNELPTVRLCTAGSVDDGKSTFVGRLLHDTKSILSDQYEAVQRSSEARGLAEADLSLLVDGLRAEREQGITIDVAYRYFATDQRKFILADCPGHEQYTRNTVTGMSTADVVILLIDVRNGVVRQTNRHATVAGLLGVPHVVVAVNKIDLVDYDEATFRTIEDQVAALADRAHLNDVRVVPISSLKGDNVVERSARTPWYTGPSIVEILENIDDAATVEDAADQALRLPVDYVIRDHDSEYRGFAGRIAAGSVGVGDEVTVTDGRTARITTLSIAGDPVEAPARAVAGSSVSVELDTDIDLSRGALIAGTPHPHTANTVQATIVHTSQRPLVVRRRLLLRYGAHTTKAQLSDIQGIIDVDSGTLLPTRPSEFNDEPVTTLESNELARVTIKTRDAIPFEPYQPGGKIGSFLLIDDQTGDTVAAGLVLPREAEQANRATA
ncbi:GTP-binding protein [Corynebacterium pseudokroppenstedtii]|uniref:sulfate adenylyltransferase n=1 Tax=Corynebacterium pseudokroppenstedtii TaxID=2804917 RepID=A0AAU0PY01_9CORY|nr:GTP-binding protein [Corynebacterium pseudokroppenstedtii]MDU6478638.1 GTP-binding protein [Corynebacterium kroppenstedtii]MBY0791414.1 GTP-binding protein [Corynebacterium pseudokroppenstedtii]MCF6794050.1 GTP-binding protein [Corynebacterium pseudokroppenstedtii]MCF8703428.1 GTP-binding protein [Corynebacterium pseudokroppenstedtii]MCG2637037.1 GTP-binding protein [Corynebacterium pseudokroppenstedtii]